MTKQGRERRDRCKEYLRRGGDLPTAVALAARAGFRQNTSVWIGALSEILDEQTEERRPKAK